MQGHTNRLTDLFEDAETLTADQRFGVYANQFLAEYLLYTERPIRITEELSAAVTYLYNRGINPVDGAAEIASRLGVEGSQLSLADDEHEEDHD